MMKREVEIDPKKFREGNISLILDSYDDIFSDFDPRPFAFKGVSDDFLLECKKATLDKNNEIELRLLVPRNKRDIHDEVKIKKRLREYFHKHFKEREREIEKIKVAGFFWFFGGVLMMVLGIFLMSYTAFLFKVLMIMVEPAGWFFFWEGLGKVFIHSKEKVPDFSFYKKMSTAQINFVDY